jgi:hypothetical protein
LDRRRASAGEDPNDLGDREWSDPTWHINEYYLPRLTERSVVLELGPGTGRVSRHLIGRCRELILVDYSQLVCNWLAEYLEGKGRFRIGVASVSSFQVQRTTVPAASVVYLFSDGVFEIVTKDHRRWTQSDFLPLLLQPAIPGTPDVERIYRSVRQVAEPGPLDDDLSLMALTFP